MSFKSFSIDEILKSQYLKHIVIYQITADPADINILPEYGKDPRVVTNLVDGVNKTQDDMFLWLTPFTPGAHHYIRITFIQDETIAMLRIWVK